MSSCLMFGKCNRGWSDAYGKPTFIDIQPAIVQLLKGRTLYAYNASFDIRMMRQSGHKLRLQQVEVKW